ncbi:ABC transporter ATP-binding protein [Sulfobacillus harzensis]|uniref:ABC transporter ATP-binding protein n=1 Tax=Sulfobacillus harzensis TaxID=2729629 RepID=A0A7Y0Q2A5_9FIRM|nr:ABC transporter ATP-binding protein [Sulfobacillus harzensis]NMP21721.1 ABC transporter ATP-binding protein [Sulfobacillus harzensis]
MNANQPVVPLDVPALAVHHVQKAFRDKRQRRLVNAVQDISVVVPRGEILGILGPNGSGKSTLIRMMATLLVPDTGSVEVFGLDVLKHRLEVRRLINRVSVEASFFKKLTAEENLAYATGLYGVPNRDAQRRARDILERLGLPSHKLKVPLEQLSRGQQQKVAIARALLTSPTLMLLDEPTTGLDPKSRREVQDFILEVRRTHDATIVISTHDMDEAERLCDRVAIINHGRFEAIDTPASLKARYGPTLESVFFTLIGEALEDALEDGV